MVLDSMTAEVNQKVKNAIKAKLNELGVYVDDELPDYIMILVGNRKTKDQMDDDLSLFLGHNTERFTSWLHDVLQRLNAASALQTESKEPIKEKKKEEEEEKPTPEVEEPKVEEKKKHKKKKDKSEKKKEKKEKKKKKDKDKDKEKHSKRKHKEKSKSKSKSPVEAEKLTRTIIISDSPNKEDNSLINGSKISVKRDMTEEPKSLIQLKDDDVASDVVNLRPNAEDLALGFEDEPPTKKFKTKLVSKELKNKDQGSPNTPPQTITSIEIQVDNPRAKEITARSFNDDEDAASEVTSTGAHEKLSSKRVINLREESTFPPRSAEGIGRVLSSAINSAHKSVSLGGGGIPGKKLEARVRPLITSRKVEEEEEEEEEEVDDVALPPGRLTSTLGLVLKRSHSNGDSDDNEEPPPKRLSAIASKVEVTPRPRRPGSAQANTALILRAVADAHKSVNKPSRKILEEKEEERLSRKEIFTRSYQERQSQRLSSSAEGKSMKKLAITVPNALLKDNVEMKISRKSGLDETGDEDVEMDNKPEPRIKSKILPQTKPLSTNKVAPLQMDEASRNTRFIVTLDGFGNEATPAGDLRSKIKGRAVRTPSVEEEEFIEEEVEEEWEEEEVVEEIDVVPSQPVVAERVTPTTGAATKWKAKIDASDLGAHLLVVKKEERCKFWPSCKEGSACQYIHPSIPCSVFPNCKFRDKCIYIHPNCKYGAGCAKPNCPFMHTGSRNLGLLYPAPVKGMAANPAKMIKCKFYPKCTDMNCPFMHPSILCRFGRLCPNKIACMFVHPETGHSMKWEASKSAVKKVPPSGSTSATSATVETSTTAV